MTTDKQMAANKANAQKSSGPTSAQGKARSSQNALKHGLSLPPEWDDVTRWYRIIRNDPDAVPDVGDPSMFNQLVLALAQAEASRDRASAAETAHLTTREPVKPRTRLEFIERLVAAGGPDLDDPQHLAFLIARTSDPMEREGLQIMRDIALKKPAKKARDPVKQLARYRREAEARRHRALRTLCAAISDAASENEPNFYY